MAGKSTLDPDNFPAGGKARKTQKGHDTRSLGPSDSSDSGSDVADTDKDGAYGVASIGDDDLDDNSDRNGTGEHPSAGRESTVRANGDIETDRIVGADEAGLGGGLDQAEEAQLGTTDEEIEQKARRKTGPRAKGK